MGAEPTSQKLSTYFDAGPFFQIILDNANFHENSTVTGFIHFELTKEQPLLEVYFTLLGWENVLWKERRTTGSRKRRRTKIVIVKDAMRCCDYRFLMMKSENYFKPGMYTYPISFQIPTGLPGTYVHRSGSGTDLLKWSCLYTLYWELSNGSDVLGRARCPIVIMQKPRNPIIYDVPVEISKNVTTWCCWK